MKFNKKIILCIVFIYILCFSSVNGFINNLEITAANYLASNKYINNHSNNPNEYNLEQNVLRQEIALISRRIANIDENEYCKNIFYDLKTTKPNNWACINIEPLLENNLISKNKYFNPEKNISKTEALKMIIMAVWFSDYKIIDLNNWQKETVDYAINNNILDNPFTDYNSYATRWFVFLAAYNSLNRTTKKEHITWLVTMWKALDEYNNWNKLKELYIHPEVYDGVVINTFWNKLESEKNKYDFSSIEDTLKEIEKYNKKYPNNKVLAKIRTFAWTFSPKYVKKLNNWPITVYPNNRPSVEIPLYWTKEYGDRFAKLIKKLAEKYDNNPLIAEITVNTASCLTAEPFIAPLNKKSKEELHKFWFNDSLYKAALRRGLEDYKVWKNTWVDFDFNTFVLSDWKFNELDPDFTIQLMKDFKKQYWANWIISHHWLQDPLTKSARYFYPTIKELWWSVSFQTVWPKVDFNSAIILWLEYWMTQFEMWQTKEAWGYADIWIKKLKEWSELLKK